MEDRTLHVRICSNRNCNRNRNRNLNLNLNLNRNRNRNCNCNCNHLHQQLNMNNLDSRVTEGLLNYLVPEEMAMARGEALPLPPNPTDERDDEFLDLGPVLPGTVAIRTSTRGAYSMSIPLNISAQLAESALAAVRSAQETGATATKLEAESRALDAKSRALEAKSRALRNIMGPVIAAAAITLIYLFRGRSQA